MGGPSAVRTEVFSSSLLSLQGDEAPLLGSHPNLSSTHHERLPFFARGGKGSTQSARSLWLHATFPLLTLWVAPAVGFPDACRSLP